MCMCVGGGVGREFWLHVGVGGARWILMARGQVYQPEVRKIFYKMKTFQITLRNTALGDLNLKLWNVSRRDSNWEKNDHFTMQN